jgi:XTP/dITP diphosphohydrolase
VYSARYAGIHKNSEDNINLLLSRLENTNDRGARFRTVITLVGLEPLPVFFEGVVEGSITRSPRGKNGFGYDPIFQPKGYSDTFAEMELALKNQFSHRAIAVKKLCAYLLNKVS